MRNFRYPLRALIGLSVAAALATFGAILFYGEQTERDQAQGDLYKVSDQQIRFAPVKEIVPPDAEVGYVSDVAPDPALVLTAQYALAPRLIVRKPSSAWVIGNFSKPQDFDAFGRARGLTLEKVFPRGVVVFRRSK